MADYTRPTSTANAAWAHAPDAQALVPVLPDPDGLADRFVTLTGKTLLTQGPMAGQRLEDCWLPWQRDALRATFQCRESLWLLGKGSGKSMSVAALALGYVMLSALMGINTRGQVIVCAANVEGARIVFQHITEAVLADDELRPLFRSNAQSRSLTHEASGIQIQVLPINMRAAVGRRPVLLIVDELHEVAQLSEATAALNQLRQGGANWGKDFKCVYITTMSIAVPEGEFKRVLGYARGVRDGRITDPEFLPLLYEFPLAQRPELSPLDQGEWWRGMPSLRTGTNAVGTMDAAELERELRQTAQGDDPEQFRLILSQRLGIEANDHDSLAETILHAQWDKCDRTGPIDADFTAVGIDAGGMDDPAAVAIARRPSGSTRALHITTHQFLTQVGYDRAPQNLKDIYDDARKAKTLHVLERAEDVDAAIFDLVRQAGPDVVGGDEHGRGGFSQACKDTTGHTFVSVPQNWQLGASLASLEARLLDGEIRHNFCPLTLANVQNLLVTELPSGVRKLTKRDNRVSGQGLSKIDGIIACINAVALVDEHAHRRFDVARMIG